jgi:MFS transporter, SP family, general alpha glucoside:H+ symporter
MVLQYKTAVLWSAFVCLTVINWGMDVLVSVLQPHKLPILPIFQLSNGAISVPSFQNDLGYLFENQYITSYGWQIAFNTSSSICEFFGAIGSRYFADRLGKRMTLGIGWIVSIGRSSYRYLRHTNHTSSGKGKSSLLARYSNIQLTIAAHQLPRPRRLSHNPSYSTEICPVQVRDLTTSGVQLFIGVGQLTANLVLKGTRTPFSTLAYKIPFSLQLFFSMVLLLFLPFTQNHPGTSSVPTTNPSRSQHSLTWVTPPHPPRSLG